MFGFISEKKVDEAAKKDELVKRLEKGRLEKEIRDKDVVIERLNSKIELLTAQKDAAVEDRDYYKSLENDREQIKRDKKANEVIANDLKEDRTELEHREERLKKKAARLEEDENAEYKKGYSDGLADGLRKAHDITREDRKYMTMIAMSTNQSKAIETAQKALGDGFKD